MDTTEANHKLLKINSRYKTHSSKVNKILEIIDLFTFDMSDDLFYRISLLGFLVVFSSMVFFLTKYREKKVNNIIQLATTEQINFIKY